MKTIDECDISMKGLDLPYDAFDAYVKGYKTGYVDGANALFKELVLGLEKNILGEDTKEETNGETEE